MNIDEVVKLFDNVKGSNNQFSARCPAHDDKKNSLSIGVSNDNRILIYCHAGCNIDSILDHAGLSKKDLFPENLRLINNISKTDEIEEYNDNLVKSNKSKGKPREYTKPEAEYIYRDADGSPLHKTIRWGKQHKVPFSQAKIDPKNPNSWINNMQGTKTVLYNLPEVIEGIKNNEPIFIVEGEKDCDNLQKLGFIATTSPMGALKWRPSYTEYLENAICYIIPDNDITGKKHTKKICLQLHNHAKSIKIIFLDKIQSKFPEHGDISDFIQIVSEQGKEPKKEITELMDFAIPWDEAKYDFIENKRELELLINYILKGTPYSTKNYNIYWDSGEKGVKRISNFIIIPKEFIKKDNGASVENYMKIEGITREAKLPEVLLHSSKYSTMSWVIEEWGFNANYAVGHTIKDHLRYVTTIIGKTIAKEKTIYVHTGWRKIDNKWCYMFNGGSIGKKNILVELEGNLQKYSLLYEGNYKTAIQYSLKTLKVAPLEITLPLLALTYLSPLNEFFRQAKIEPSFLLYLLGPTGTKKSTLAALFLCHFGDFDSKSLPSSFKDTANSIEKKSFFLKDTLMVIDDFHPTVQKFEANKMVSTAQAITRAYGDRTGRSRLSSNTSLRQTYIPQGNVIITGEDMPSIEQSGIARHIILELSSDDVNIDILSEVQSNSQQLAICMRGYIEFLLPQVDTLKNSLEKRFNILRKRVSEKDQHARIPETVAWLQIGYEMFLLYAVSLGIINTSMLEALIEQSLELFIKIGQEQNKRVFEDRPIYKFANVFLEMLDTGICYCIDVNSPDIDILSVAPKDNNFVGYYDENYYYIYLEVLYKCIVEFFSKQGLNFPISKNILVKQLESENMIEISKTRVQNRRTLTKRIGKVTGRFLWLKKSAFDDIDYTI